MIGVIVLASLSARALGQASAGLATCLCITEMPPAVIRIDCTFEWAVSGTCFQPTGLASNFTVYPGDYGLSCKAHKEPGHSACSDLTTVPPTEKPLSEQADWCYAPWCYVDPCNCDASDATKSDYFPDTLFYSTATCGAKNTYTALESATNTVGNAECATADETSGDAHFLKMGIGMMLLVMGAMA